MKLHRGDGTEFEPEGFVTVHAGRAVHVYMNEVQKGAVDKTITFRPLLLEEECLENDIVRRLDFELKDLLHLGKKTSSCVFDEKTFTLRMRTEDYGGPDGDGGRIITFKWWPGSLPEIISVEGWSN